MHRDRLKRERAAVLVVDLQEKLHAAMPPEWRERVVRRAEALLRGRAEGEAFKAVLEAVK